MVSTTQGYDAHAQISSSMIDRALFALFDAGIIPNHWVPPVGQVVPIDELELWFDPPHASPITRNGLDVWLRYTQGYTLRAPTLADEIKSKFSVMLPVALVDRQIGNDIVQVMRCDCSGLAFDDIDLGLAPSFTQAVAQGIIHSILTEQVGEFPLGGPLIGLPLRLNMEVREKQNFISLFAMLDGRAGPFTSPSKSLATAAAGAKGIDVAIAVDQSVYLPRIRAAIVAASLTKGRVIDINPDVIIDDGVVIDNVLRSIMLTKDIKVDVIEGAIKVSGGVSADISNAPDPSADFVLKFGVFVSGGSVSANLIDADIDIDGTIITVLSAALFGPLGFIISPIIESAVEDAIEDAIPNISQSFALPVQSLFVSGVEITNAATSSATTAVLVSLAGAAIRSDSITLLLSFTYQYTPVVRQFVPYIRINADTRQFHVASGCKFGDSIGKKRLSLAQDAAHALAQGYDGCRNCQPQFDGLGTGRVTIAYTRPAAGEKQRTDRPTFSATYKGKSPLAQFSDDWEVAGNLVMAQNDEFKDYLTSGWIAPGIWSLTVTDGDWSATSIFAVPGGRQAMHHVVYKQGG